MNNERTIFRSLENPRVLDMPIFPERVKHASTCPHGRKQVQENELLELDDPPIIVRVNAFGSTELVRKLDDYPPAPVEIKNNINELGEPRRVRITKTGAIIGD